MAGEDYSVKTKVTADVSNFEKGMNKAEKSLKGFSDKLANSIDRLGKKGLIGSIANVTLAMQGLTKSFGTVIKFAKDVGKAINECTEAYKGQVIAERALDTAIQNNPFISGASSKALKQFASDMQRVTNYGDEELIPMMTNLVSLGRTESEVMQIMSVAMDMSAGMGISLDTAITQLNATLNGNIGRLGQQNAELKGLTEEELKQGKAIEILGEKFKGLSSATADTSKQLANIKGDFKEALGQFTLPSSDLWNKFWAGFYQKGIEAINKINAFMDSQIIGKKLANAITEQIARINPADIGGRIDYTRNVLRVIGDNELEALKNYLSGLRTLSAEQEIILKRIKAEEDSRYQNSINAKKEAEDKKKQADAEEKITAEVQKQEEIASKKTDWSSKLLDQRIEMLETERDRAMQLAEEEGQETYTIWRDYNEKILELKLERLEKEKAKALEEEGLTAEDKIKIEEYYSGETKKVYNELGNYKKKKKKEEEKGEKSKFKIILEYLAQYAKKVADTISNIAKKVASVAKDVISKVGSIFKGALNVFKFNPDDALNSLLAIEDTILTFFVETLPKLPQFFSSAIQSIIILIRTLLNAIDWDKVQEIINSVIDIIVENAPQIVNDLVDLVIHIAQTVLNAIIHFVESGGWKTLLDLLLDIQKKIENFFIENIDDIVNKIADMIPDLIEFLKNSIVSASKTLGKLAPKILPLIADLINAIIDAITSDEVVNASLEAIEGIIEGLVPAIVKLLTNALPKIINFSLLKLPSYTPKLVSGIIKGLIKGFSNVNWGQVVKDIFTGFIDAVKDLFGIHSPSTLFEGFGGNIVEGLVNGLKGISEAVNAILEPLYNLISNIFGSIGDTITNSINVSFEGLKNILDSIGTVLKNLTDVSFKGFKDIIESSGNALSKITDSVTGLVKALGDLVDKLPSATSLLGGGGSGGGGSSGGNSLPGSKSGTSANDPWDWADPLHLLPGHARGTNSASAGLALVGEAGPELVKFRGGEQVLNAHNTNKALENMGGNTNNFNVTFNNLKDTSAFAMMNQLKQYNRQMAINGVI